MSFGKFDIVGHEEGFYANVICAMSPSHYAGLIGSLARKGLTMEMAEAFFPLELFQSVQKFMNPDKDSLESMVDPASIPVHFELWLLPEAEPGTPDQELMQAAKQMVAFTLAAQDPGDGGVGARPNEPLLV